MISRYLFRDGVLSYKGTSLSMLLEVALKDDFMLAAITTDMPADESDCYWSAYKMVWFDSDYGWHPQPNSVAQELRALLLLQQ